jgi:hypothetical protein
VINSYKGMYTKRQENEATAGTQLQENEENSRRRATSDRQIERNGQETAGEGLHLIGK